MEPTIEDYQAYAPLLAYMDGKSDAEQGAILAHFVRMPEDEKLVLVDTVTVNNILSLISRGVLPQTHGKAVAQLIYLVLNGQVATDAIAGMLQRLNLPALPAQQIATSIQSIIAPALEARAAALEPIDVGELNEVPPLTTTAPLPPAPIAPVAAPPAPVAPRAPMAPTPPPAPTWPGGTQPTAHTILDLRTNKPPTQ